MRTALTVLLALLVAIVAFAAVAPAALLEGRVASATEGRLHVSDAEGTVWHGRGALTDAAGFWRVPLAWRVDPLALARGAVAWTFEPLPDGSGPRGSITLRENAIEMRDVAIAVPATFIRSLVGKVPVPELGGELRVAAPAFRYDTRSGDGALDVRWERARVVWNGSVLDLGSAHANATPRGAEIVATLDNAGGTAKVTADATLTATSASVHGSLIPGPEVPPDIARLLSALGPADANRAIRFEWRGSLR